MRSDSNNLRVGGVCLQSAAYDTVPKRFPITYTDLGECELKGFDQLVRCYSVELNPGECIPALEPQSQSASAIGKLISEVSTRVIIGLAALVLIIIAGATLWSLQQRSHSSLPKKPSIAVLPFQDLGNNSELTYKVDGFTNAIITNLSRFPELFVVSSHSSFQFKDQAIKVAQVGEQLGVQYILQGTYQQSSNSLQISAQLTDSKNGSNIWADNFSVDLKGVIDLQIDISNRITSTLAPVMFNKVRSQALRLTDDDSLEAYDLYLIASKYKHGKEEMRKSLARLERAVALEPEFAIAHALLAFRYVQSWRLNLTADADHALKRGRESAQRAVELDPTDYRVHNTLCSIHLYADRKHELALSECQRAVELNPNDSEIQITLAQVLAFMGRSEEGLKWIARAKQLNPLFQPFYYWTSSFIHALAGNYEISLVEAEQALTVYKNSLSIRRIMIFSLVHLNRLDEARQLVKESLEIAPDFTLAKLRNTPYQHKVDNDRVLNAFRKAGFPQE
ncbi:MAG: TolB-like protein [Parasphingorhabdus sp.]